jgi:hypothetical protein
MPAQAADRLDDGLEIRRTGPGERGAALALLARALEWGTDPAAERRYDWEHVENPFGGTLAWAAFEGARMVGLRHFLRWEFETADGVVVPAVRAVDTVTDPDYRRRGIFRRLTLGALDDLRREGVSFVFNTPNEQSRPGYLAFGWEVAGTWRWARRVASLPGARHSLGARGAAEEISLPSDLGVPAGEALADGEGVAALVASRRRPRGLQTRLSAEFLRWRYGPASLGHRALMAGPRVENGLAIVRVRPRGPLREAVVCDLQVPAGAERRAGRLIRRLVRSPEIDLVTRLGGPPLSLDGFVRVPRRGWTVVWRPIGDDAMPDPRRWNLTFGDLELF